MRTRNIGTSELQSSCLAYGCWRIAGSAESNEISFERAEHAKAAVRAAYEAGFTLFDHADIYSNGFGEELFGQVLKDSHEMRNQVLVASKSGIIKGSKADAHLPYRYDSSASHIIQSCEGSLHRLGVDQIHIYMIHRPDFLGHPDEIAQAVSDLKRQGKIKEFGVSNYTPSQLRLIRKAVDGPIVVNQVEISLIKLDAFSDGTLEECMLENTTPMAWSPLGGGKLTGQESLSLQTADHGHRGKIRDSAEYLARHHGVSRSAILLSWLLMHPSGILPVVGTTNPDHIRQAAAAASLELSREEWYYLMEAGKGQRLP